jgi:hypothetical protein
MQPWWYQYQTEHNQSSRVDLRAWLRHMFPQSAYVPRIDWSRHSWPDRKETNPHQSLPHFVGTNLRHGNIVHAQAYLDSMPVCLSLVSCLISSSALLLGQKGTTNAYVHIITRHRVEISAARTCTSTELWHLAIGGDRSFCPVSWRASNILLASLLTSQSSKTTTKRAMWSTKQD